jgi:hypothetical protein
MLLQQQLIPWTSIPSLLLLHHTQVQAVLQNAIEKLALMSVLVVDPASQAHTLTKSVGEEISRMIVQQKQLEHRFQELIAAQPALRTLPNKDALQGNQAELQEVSAALRQATKQLCRNLRDNPNISQNMAKVAAQREALQVLFSNTLDSLAAQGTVQPIIEAVLAAEQAEVGGACKAHRARLPAAGKTACLAPHHTTLHAAWHTHTQVHMRELVEAEKAATAQVKGLKSDLATEKAQHEQQVRVVAMLVPAAACMQHSGGLLRQAVWRPLACQAGNPSHVCLCAGGDFDR